MERQVRNAVDAGDGDYSLRVLRESVIAHPADLAPRLELARAYQQRGSIELAIDHYRIAIERFPESAEAQLLFARALAAAGKPDAAATALDSFLNAHPQTSAQYYSWLGIFRDDAEAWSEGEKAHREAIRLSSGLDQDRDYLHNNLGWCLLKQNRRAEAAEEFRVALKLNPHSAVARDNLAAALALEESARREAILHWQSVTEPAAAHNNLAAILIEQGKYAEARAEIAKALSYNRSFPAALSNLKLLSELDGKPAMVNVESSPAFWSRWKQTLHRWFGSSHNTTPAPQPESTQTAARS